MKEAGGSSGQAPQKKFVIKSFKPASGMDLHAAQAVWQSLSMAIDEIYNKNASTLRFEELYRNGYNLVLHKHGEMLYNGVAGVVRRHLLETVEHVAATPNEHLVESISVAWSEHKVAMNMVADILMYMDRTYVSQHKKTPIYKLSLQIFRDEIIYHAGVRDRLRSILLENILNERNGYLIDRDLMKTTLAMLVDLGVDGLSVYEEEIERHFLEATRIFYRQESSEFLSQNTCPDYLWKAEQRLAEVSSTHLIDLSIFDLSVLTRTLILLVVNTLVPTLLFILTNPSTWSITHTVTHTSFWSPTPSPRPLQEAHRVIHYLSSSSEPKLKHLVESELINAHARTLVEMDTSGSICLMRDDKIDDLKRMYTLFSRIPSTLDILRWSHPLTQSHSHLPTHSRSLTLSQFYSVLTHFDSILTSPKVT